MHTTQGRTCVCLGRTEKGAVMRKHQYIPIEGNLACFPGLDCELNSGRDLSHLTSFPRRSLDKEYHFGVRQCFQSLRSVQPPLLLEGSAPGGWSQEVAGMALTSTEARRVTPRPHLLWGWGWVLWETRRIKTLGHFCFSKQWVYLFS